MAISERRKEGGRRGGVADVLGLAVRERKRERGGALTGGACVVERGRGGVRKRARGGGGPCVRGEKAMG